MSQALLEVTVAWGPTILDVHHLGVGESFTLGEHSPYGGIEDLVPAGTSMTLARVDADEIRLWLPEGVAGTYQTGDELTPLPAEQSRSLVLGRAGRLRAEAGALTLYFQRVEAAERPGRGSLRGLFGDLRGIGGAAVLHAVFLLVAITLPPDGDSLSLDHMDTEPRWVAISAVPEDQIVKDLFKALDSTGEKGGGEGGEPTDSKLPPSGSITEPAQVVKKGGGGSPLTLDQRRGIARKAAAELDSVFETAGNDLFGGADPLGKTAAAALAGMGAGDRGDGFAMNGGPGGGDRGWGGMGPPGGGHGPGGPGGPGLEPGGYKTRPGRPGPRTLYPGERGDGAPKFKVLPQAPLVEDGLSREEIQRVVRTKQAEYRYCYEKQLQSRPDLEGKITLKFVVGPNGRVLLTEVADSTMADPEVASCIAHKAKQWQFPPTRGGGVVAVKYPFLFRRS